MKKPLTISIVTADRPCVKDCLLKLSLQPSIDQVDVRVIDNSTNLNLRSSIKLECNKYGFLYEEASDFITARNLSIRLCNTQYFTILDDDDFYAPNAVELMLSHIDLFGNFDMLCYGVEKVGRTSNFDHQINVIKGLEGKLLFLNNFHNYDEDRLDKIYLWNGGIIFNTQLLKNHCRWYYKGCDDIYPVTKAYLISDTVIKVNSPIYYYPAQNTVQCKKSIEQLQRLEDNMCKSYKMLFDYISQGDTGYNLKRRILMKAVDNSIQQLQVLDLYEPLKLKELKLKCTY